MDRFDYFLFRIFELIGRILQPIATILYTITVSYKNYLVEQSAEGINAVQ